MHCQTTPSDPTPPDPIPPRCEPRPVLRGQTALVTGGTSGIGRGIALAMAQAGAAVAVNYIGDADAAEEVLDQIRRDGNGQAPRAIAHRADVSREDQVQEMFRRVADELGGIDILVNNAGIQRDSPVQEMTLEQWDQVIAVNLTGQFLCAREAVGHFRRRGVRPELSCAAGKIVFIGSVHDTIPWAGHVNYAASKGGALLLMKSIAQEAAPWRIRVNGISPGAIQTPINRPAWESPEALKELLKLVPYGRIGQPEDVARLAVWLASDESDYIVGANIRIDGGMTLYPAFAEGG